MKVGSNMIEPGSKIRMTVRAQNTEIYFAMAEVMSISGQSITIKYVCKVHNDKKGKIEPEFRTESFLMTRVKKIQEWL